MPCLAALPLPVIAAEVVTQNFPWPGFNEMPGADKVKRGISRSEAAHVNDTGEALIGHEHVSRYEIAVGRGVSASSSGRCPQSPPHPAKSRYVQQSLAAREAPS